MWKVRLVGLVVAACAAPAAVAKPGLSVTPATVASGGTITLSGSVATAGDGVYFVVDGPGTFNATWSVGPVAGTFSFDVSTSGWAPGKYRIKGYEVTTKMAVSIGAVVVTVT